MSLLESSFEVVGLAGNDSLVEVEVIGSATQLTVRVFFREMKSGASVSFIDYRTWLPVLTPRSPF